MKNRDVRLCGIACLHPEIPFCTQTGHKYSTTYVSIPLKRVKAWQINQFLAIVCKQKVVRGKTKDYHSSRTRSKYAFILTKNQENRNLVSSQIWTLSQEAFNSAVRLQINAGALSCSVSGLARFTPR